MLGFFVLSQIGEVGQSRMGAVVLEVEEFFEWVASRDPASEKGSLPDTGCAKQGIGDEVATVHGSSIPHCASARFKANGILALTRIGPRRQRSVGSLGSHSFAALSGAFGDSGKGLSFAGFACSKWTLVPSGRPGRFAT